MLIKREFIKLSNDIWFYKSFMDSFIFIKENPEYGFKPLAHLYDLHGLWWIMADWVEPYQKLLQGVKFYSNFTSFLVHYLLHCSFPWCIDCLLIYFMCEAYCTLFMFSLAHVHSRAFTSLYFKKFPDPCYGGRKQQWGSDHISSTTSQIWNEAV